MFAMLGEPYCSIFQSQKADTYVDNETEFHPECVLAVLHQVVGYVFQHINYLSLCEFTLAGDRLVAHNMNFLEIAIKENLR